MVANASIPRFAAPALRPETALPLDAVAGLEWRTPSDIDPDELAFPSLKMALAVLTSEPGSG